MIAPSESGPGPWLRAWLALLAPVYLLSPLALLGLRHLRLLPPPARWLLGLYALSQQLPALLTPEPLLASALALGRTLLMFGLLGLGTALAGTRHLRAMAPGLLVVYVTALAFSVLAQPFGAEVRLAHPYMTPITMGLAGALGVWLALFGGGHAALRLAVGLGGGLALLSSGSRGPLAAAVAGVLFALALRGGRRAAPWLTALWWGAGLVTLGLLVGLGARAGVPVLGRLTGLDLTGRDLVWAHTLGVIGQHPLAGVGSYRLGQSLAPPGGCALFPGAGGVAPVCPEWLQGLGSPWLIAHNLGLHQWAETGPLGWAGLLALLGGVLGATLRGRDPLAGAVVVGLLVASLADNTLLVPSPFFAEVFWLVAGTQLRHFQPPPPTFAPLQLGLGAALSLPMVAAAFLFPAPAPVPTSLLIAPLRVSTPVGYTVTAQFDLPPGAYRLSLETCVPTCSSLAVQPFRVGPGGAPAVQLRGTLADRPRQQVQLRLLRGESSLDLRPLGVTAWTVQTGSGETGSGETGP